MKRRRNIVKCDKTKENEKGTKVRERERESEREGGEKAGKKEGLETNLG